MIDEIETKPDVTLLSAVAFNPDLDVLDWSKLEEEILPQGEHLKTNEIIDQQFILLSMKQYVSNMNEQDYAYHVVGSMVKGKKLFNTTIGGGQPMEVLDAIHKAGILNPIKFTLRWIEGGKYGGYYIFG